ncbi:MAG: chemotaxis protein CheV [Betaproteobacteria bacterium]|nr:chemotaxis protein CheV [Betaproteobacteria bacterium]
MGASDYRLINMVNEKTRLAGSNKMELLLFSLGGRETFGINVFKVREVCELMPITATPNMPVGVAGIVSLRGAILPVIDLAPSLGFTMPSAPGKLIITEFSSHTQGFLVGDVDRIVRVDWEEVRAPQTMLAATGSHVTALTELPDGRLVSILDVEQILAEVMGEEPVPTLDALDADGRSVFFADDSALARKKIVQVLEGLKLPFQQAHNGREALEKLTALAAQAEAEKRPLRDTLGLVLVDAEMPEMDGYVLTRSLKSDARFTGIPVVMHSSLSSVANKKLGQQVGVDAYVAKFKPEELGDCIARMLRG